MTSRSTIAFRYMWRQKTRTGFVIATYAATVAVTLLITSAVVGEENYFLNEVSTVGANWIYVYPGNGNSPSIYPLTERAAGDIFRNVSHVSAVAPVMAVGLSVPSWGTATSEDIVGTNSSVQGIFGYQVVAGAFNINWNGNFSVPLPVVMGYSEWTGHALSVGQMVSGSVVSLTGTGISTRPVNMVITGLLAPRGSLGGTDLDTLMFIPVQALENLTNSLSLTYIFVSASDSKYVAQVADDISVLLLNLHKQYDDFTVTSEESLVQLVQNELNQFTSIISLVEFTLLLLSAMSVFVVMMMAVKDRRREVGVMRAIGARRGDIMAQFLLEASLMSVGGMIVGVGMGSAIAGYLKANAGGFYANLLPNPLDLGTYFVELLCILFAVGFLFSMAPAYQASRLEAVEALRSL
jgi:putative ABC transport system permease protein